MDYSVARGMFGVIAALGWVLVVAGVLALLFLWVAAPPRSNALLGALIVGGPVVLAGLFLVAISQFGRATVDTAEHAGEIRSMLAEQARAQRKIASLVERLVPGAAPDRGPFPTQPPLEMVGTVPITVDADGYFLVGGRPFLTLVAARNHAQEVASRG